MRRVFFLLLFVLLLPGWVGAQSVPSMMVMTEDLPPFNFMENGHITGISTEVVRLVFRDAGVAMKQDDIQLYPWARAYHIIKHTPETALYSMARTAEREELFSWVGPLLSVTIGVVAKKERKIEIHTVDDLKLYRIGTVRDSAPEQLLIKAGVPLNNLERLALPKQNIRKLCADRIDLFAFNVQTVRYQMVRLGINPDEYETVYILKKPNLYLALYKETNPKLVEKLQKSLDRLKQPNKDGVILFNRIVDKYLSAKH